MSPFVAGAALLRENRSRKTAMPETESLELEEPGTPWRRARATAVIVSQTGIDEAMIAALVHGFYARVREDALLAPVFAPRIADWDAHLARMCAFWSSVVLLSGRYHGRPMDRHLPLPVTGRHFDRWLELFEETARDLCPPAAAALFIDRAHRIARSLAAGIAAQAGAPA